MGSKLDRKQSYNPSRLKATSWGLSRKVSLPSDLKRPERVDCPDNAGIR